MFPLWIRWLFGFLFSAISLGGLFGNGLVIAAVLGHPKMRCSAMNILLLNLAIADLLNLALTSLEWAPALWIGRPQWPLEWWWTCPLVRYFEYVFLFASILSQLAVCTERFVAICLPLHARRWCTHRNVLNSLLFIWAFVLLFSLPNALFNERIQIKKSSSHSMALCLNPWSFTELWLTYKWAEFLFLFLVPAICCALLHCRLHFALKKTSAAGNVYQQELLHKNKTIQYRQMRSRRRVAHKLLGCMAVQLLCYSPIQAMFLATALFDIVLIPPYGLILLLNVLALACSAANPLLYTLCSQNFRSRTKAMFIGQGAGPKRIIMYADQRQPFNRIRAATI